jgi:O-succinylbenzoic acid--CoA ligase
VVHENGWSRPPKGSFGDEDLALLVATSGTVGGPRLVELTRGAVQAAVHGSATVLDAAPEEPWLSCLTPAHVGGLLVLLRAALLGAPVIAHGRFDPAAVELETRARFVSVVPTMLVRLLDAGVHLARFRAILVGGAELGRDVRSRAKDAGAPIVETYGLTESCGGVVYEGRPFPGTSVAIEPATSEILLAGPTLMRRYRDAPTDVFTDGRWLRTGDLGRLDESGLLHVLGRRDDIIVTGGDKVRPEEVEAAVRSHAKVADVAVAGHPDPEWGSRVTAFVVPRNPRDPPTLDELRDVAMTTLPGYAAPRELVLLDELPRTPSGKVRRSALARARGE